MADTAPRGFWRTFLSVFLTFVLVTIIGLAIALQVIPRMLGGTSLTVLTGSMQPTINPGDVIAVRAADPDEIRVGDIVAFQPVSGDPTLITHRVVGKGISPTEGIFFTTQGDANSAPDERIVAAQVQGVYMYRVPYLGYVLQLGRNLGMVSVIAGVVLVIAALVLVFRPSRRRPPTDDDDDGRTPDLAASAGGASDSADDPAATGMPPASGPTASAPLTRRDRRARGSALALVILAAAFAAPVLVPSGEAYARPVPVRPGGGSVPASAPALRVDLVGPAVSVAWNGQMQYDRPESIFGDRIVVPGDRIGRVIRIANPADSEQVLRAHLSGLMVTGDGGWADVLRLSWAVLGQSAPQTSGIGVGGAVSADIPIDPGESVDVTMWLDYPVDASVPAAAGVAASSVSFDITLVGERVPEVHRALEPVWTDRTNRRRHLERAN